MCRIRTPQRSRHDRATAAFRLCMDLALSLPHYADRLFYLDRAEQWRALLLST